MDIKLASPEEIKIVTNISKRAFNTDVLVGANEEGGPPDYDSENWHKKMMLSHNLYTIMQEDYIIGGAVLFQDKRNKEIMYVGRIFIDPNENKKGFGLEAMKYIEKMFPKIKIWRLETPVWNIRTNSFYKKLGYMEMYRDKESVYYQKELNLN
ncbi:MAG: GNAT family N-acetyltransferase [Lachnotalea sp.]